MNTDEFEQWKTIREKGLTHYLLLPSLIFILLSVAFLTIVGLFNPYVTFSNALRNELGLFTIFIIFRISRWFYREFTFKKYLEIFNSK